MLNAAVIGIGYWGPNIVRNFHAHPEINLKYCCDLKQERLDAIKKTFPYVSATLNLDDILKDTSIDLVAICTPVFSHYELAKACLQHGKNVLVEKPMTYTSAEAEHLLNLSEQKKLKIFVDHTFLYTGAVRKIKDLIRDDALGDLYYFDSVRVNLGIFQHDVNVIWDLAPHDISIMYYLLDQKPEAVLATGSDHFNNGLENIAYITIFYPNQLIAHIHANWLSPVKIRQTLIAGSKNMVVWDDNKPSEKVLIYDKGVNVINTADDVYKMLIQYRAGDMYCPKIDSTEALAKEVDYIVKCLLHGEKNGIANGNTGFMVVKILEAAQKSIKNNGMEVKI